MTRRHPARRLRKTRPLKITSDHNDYVVFPVKDQMAAIVVDPSATVL